MQPSIGTAETTLLRAAEPPAQVRPGWTRPTTGALVRQRRGAREPGAARRDARSTLPPDAFDWAAEVAEEWIEWIKGSGVDVVGDLKDLRSAPPAGGRALAGPGPAVDLGHARAAIDALVAMTLEAANRPDPDEQIAAKIGRAAKRLRGQ